jgi:hypothetical protein
MVDVGVVSPSHRDQVVGVATPVLWTRAAARSRVTKGTLRSYTG